MRPTSPLLVLVGLVASLAISTLPSRAAEPDRLTLGMDGRAHLTFAGQEFGTLSPAAATPTWTFATQKTASYQQTGEVRKFTMHLADMTIAGQAQLLVLNSTTNATWTFTPSSDQQVACLAITADFPASNLIGGTWKAGDQQGTFPVTFGRVHLFSAQVPAITLTSKAGKTLTFTFPHPTPVLIQDNRQWTQQFVVRIGSQGTNLTKGQNYEIAMTIKANTPLQATMDSPITITAGDEWIPLKTELEIEPGSALDFSSFGFADAPAGKLGRVIATPEGHFAFANAPQTPRRFYGVNFCFDAQYIPHDQADQLADRLVRLGYNTIRIHHYESKLTEGKSGFDWNPDNLDKLDYFVAAMKKRGIYVTTDLYVSRPVSAQQLGMPGNESWAYKFKVLVPVYEPAFRDWETFTRKLLDHVNPYTQIRWGDDPTIAWLSMINEGNFGNYWKEVKTIPQWKETWNQWLTKRYADRAALAASWAKELKADEDPAAGTVALPDNVYGDSPRHRDCTIFLAETERTMFARMAKFLHEDLKCQALLTNMNAWTNHVPNQLARELFDYVDDHFYVDHPQFVEKDWQLPSRCANENPVKEGAPGGRNGNAIRIFGKPFTVSEYNYAAPGRFRGVGGILTGAQAALQDWDVIWRFAYSHSNKNLFTPSQIGYFDLVSDPLNQAADRAAIMLYLRGDLKPAPHRVAMVMSEQDLEHVPNKVPTLNDAPAWVTWITGLGSVVATPNTKAPRADVALHPAWSPTKELALSAFGTDRKALVNQLRAQGILTGDNPTDPAKNIFQSETGEVLIDAPKGLLRFDTDKTAGGYAEPGQSLTSPRAGVEIFDLSIGATVFVTSVDDQPIRSSRRLLVTHLTDLQNTGATYAEAARQTLLSWGHLPHLVRAGSATVRVAVADPQQWTVYALTTSGKRLSEVSSKAQDGKLTFTCDVKGPEGARMLYELARK